MKSGRRMHRICMNAGGNCALNASRKIDASIAAHAEYEYLYDKPYEDRTKVRVAGPFTVESISPHRVLGVDENGDVIDGIAEPRNGYSGPATTSAPSSWTTCAAPASSRLTRRTASPSRR